MTLIIVNSIEEEVEPKDLKSEDKLEDNLIYLT